MTDRTDLIHRFLTTAGWQNAKYQPMVADASFRSYARLTDPAQSPATAILMNAPPETNNPVTEFTDIAEHLLGYGYSAPEIYARDTGNGLLLIEDLGDDLFARLCEQTPDIEPALYAAAVDVLADLARRAAPAGLLPYSTDVYIREAKLATDWYMPAALGKPVDDTLRADFAALIANACRGLSEVAPVLVCRDYHAENLLWLEDRSGLARVGLLDFQDALAGHPAYDLVSLLEDARRDTSEQLRTDMMVRYLQATGTNPDSFHRAYCTLGAQRNLKIIGIFTRLALRDGKSGYINLIPRVWAHLLRDLSHPDLSDLRHWVEAHLPEPTATVLARITRRTDET